MDIKPGLVVVSPPTAIADEESKSKTNLPGEEVEEEDNKKQDDGDQGKQRKKSAYGKTMDGTVFKIPETHNMVSSLFDPRLPKSSLDLITLSTLIAQTIPLMIFTRKKLKIYYMISFLFWRLTYNVGLGWILKKQSENKFIIKIIKNLNLFNSKFNPKLFNWIEKQLKSKMSTNNLNYDLNQFPIEFNVWLLFRQLVDIILLNDFLSYFCLSYCSLNLPNQQQQQQQSILEDPQDQQQQSNLIIFLVRYAHRIVHDFAWYWGDAFFLSLQELVFDGVFEMAPHPMYSIGYAGFYGASLITGSQSVFFVSLFAHLCQFGFLVYFENPHIQRTYGPQARPLTAASPRQSLRSRRDPIETHHDTGSVHGSNTHQEPLQRPVDPAEVREQLEHRLFSGKEMIMINNFDKFRALLISSLNAIAWRIWFSFGLGFRLKQQSQNKMMVKHFLTNYYYPIGKNRHSQQRQEDEINNHDQNDLMDELKFEVIEECFQNWKGIYNLSLIMTYGLSHFPKLYYFFLAQCLVGIHVWTAISTYEVLGKFGWFYAGFIGMSLMSGNKFVFALALGSVLCHWWFLSFVETPHMKKVYGDRIRKEAGLTKVLKQNAQKLAARRKNLDYRLDRESGVVWEAAEAWRGKFLEKSAPRLSGVVRDTKVLLQSSGERLILTRIANDLSSYDTTQYRLTIQESRYHHGRDPTSNRLRFHMGEPIRLEWTSPWNHSRADWIGCYRRGSNKSGLVTEVASSGRWCGLFEEEWEGDMHIGKRSEEGEEDKERPEA
ncbi:hypothetical protein H4Q26_011259 [Puccinia striiformis f. sp. tritici PST-130]|nr:hypothetical protein H4Q26_011259 [Puccinia striiformis f. sp. tritici PST-130]